MYLGKIVGHPSVLNPKDVTAITDSLLRDDHANDMYLQREAMYMLQEPHCRMSRYNASCQLTHILINKSGGLINRWDMKSQKTSTKKC